MLVIRHPSQTLLGQSDVVLHAADRPCGGPGAHATFGPAGGAGLEARSAASGSAAVTMAATS